MSQQSVCAPLTCTQHSLSSNKTLVCHAQTPLLMQSPTHNQLFCDDACGEDQQQKRDLAQRDCGSHPCIGSTWVQSTPWSPARRHCARLLVARTTGVLITAKATNSDQTSAAVQWLSRGDPLEARVHTTVFNVASTAGSVGRVAPSSQHMASHTLWNSGDTPPIDCAHQHRAHGSNRHEYGLPAFVATVNRIKHVPHGSAPNGQVPSDTWPPD